MTREEAIICKVYLEDLDKHHTCNEYKLLMQLLEQEPTTRNDLAQERYQDLIEYFDDEKVAKAILESRKEFKAWLKRVRWYVKKADELARVIAEIEEIEFQKERG